MWQNQKTVRKLGWLWANGYLWWLIGFTMLYRTTYPLVIEHSYANGPFIDDLPPKNGDVPVRYLRSPETTMVYHTT